MFYCAVDLVWFDRSLPAQQRRLALVLLATNGIFGLGMLFLHLYPLDNEKFPIQFVALVVSLLLVLIYGYAGFRHNISNRKFQRGSLQSRLVSLVLVVTVPLLFGITYFISTQSGKLIDSQSKELLRQGGSIVVRSIRLWLQSKVQVLQQTAVLPDIYNMEAELQKPILANLSDMYADINFISTVDPTGRTVARSDQDIVESYRDEAWFDQASQGLPYVLQAVPSGDSGQLALIISVPVFRSGTQLVGYLMSSIGLSSMVDQMDVPMLGKKGIVFIVDDQDRVILNTDASFASISQNMEEYVPVKALRDGLSGEISFTDLDGIDWRAYVEKLENGWGVVVQQPESELNSAFLYIQRSAGWAGFVGLCLLLGLVWITVRQSLQPIQSLTQVAKAISDGDLSRSTSVESSDELGILAQSFNRMTAQLRESILDLEQRVTERTHDLNRRSRQLEAAAKVSRETAAIRDIHQLLTRTTHLISRNFGFYHVGIFLIDDSRQYAVLQASNSEGGHRMLERGHKLRVGQVGIVGYVANSSLPRIALDVGEDAVFFNNPDLPETRSEMALPLKVRDLVIGVLDVQSTQPSAFSDEDVEVLQLMADQVALALENTRLLQESRSALEELQILYGRQTRQVWRHRLGRKSIAYRYNHLEVHPVDIPPQADTSNLLDGSEVQPRNGYHELNVPLVLRGQALGSLVLRREIDQQPWSEEERNLATDLISSVLPALEIARLLEEIQNRAQLESLVSQVSTRVQSSLNLETVVKTAVEEIGLAVNASRVQIRLSNGEPNKPLPTDDAGDSKELAVDD